jgi:hypothetical protein
MCHHTTSCQCLPPRRCGRMREGKALASVYTAVAATLLTLAALGLAFPITRIENPAPECR